MTIAEYVKEKHDDVKKMLAGHEYQEEILDIILEIGWKLSEMAAGGRALEQLLETYGVKPGQKESMKLYIMASNAETSASQKDWDKVFDGYSDDSDYEESDEYDNSYSGFVDDYDN